jgi:hypothetical protein
MDVEKCIRKEKRKEEMKFQPYYTESLSNKAETFDKKFVQFRIEKVLIHLSIHSANKKNRDATCVPAV